jgi:hypothetical protein
MPELTPQQSAFAHHYVTNGGNAAKAARAAGYSAKSAREIGHALIHKNHVVDAIRDEQKRLLSGELATIALNTLKSVMLDKAAPTGARVDAAKAVLDRGGLPSTSRSAEPPRDGEQKALSDMTIDELDAFIAAGAVAVDKARDAMALSGESVRLPAPGSDEVTH